VRNTGDYETARLFMHYLLSDSSGKPLNSKQLELFLFDKKTGEPFGESGLGDIHAHRFTTESKTQFPYRGAYNISLVHAMRTDTLAEILSVGVRVEKVE
jgi:gliding motility-associated lipoprotein GldH